MKQAKNPNPVQAFQNITITLIALALYSGLYAVLVHLFLPDGVNFTFVNMLWKLALSGAVGFTILFLSFMITKKGKLILGHFSNRKFVPADLVLLLFPLTPVVQYLMNNQDILNFADSVFILAIFLFFSALLVFGFPAVIRSIASGRMLKSLGMAFSFTIISMALLSSAFDWFRAGNFLIQLGFLFGVFLMVWLLSSPKNRSLLLILVVVLFAVNTACQWFSLNQNSESSRLHNTDNPVIAAVDGKTVVRTPDVYLLIYDAYVANETMQSYGIDNSAQEGFLVDQGFTLYPHNYSVGASTLDSMNKVMNVSFDNYGNDRTGVSGGGTVQSIFKSLGYQTYGIFPSDFMFRGYGSSYDVSIPASSSSSSGYLISAIFIGEFRFDLGFEKQPHEEYVQDKLALFATLPGSKQPFFLYSHSNYPEHSQNSGKCLVDEVQQYQQRLAEANAEMKEDVETILSNDPGAVIIIAGDHGPYLTKNCTYTSGEYNASELTRQDIQDRYGSFLAIRWPEGDYTDYDKIIVLQDIFPAVFAFMYEDASILSAEIEPVIPLDNHNSGISVDNGMIVGGVNNGEPLYLSGK